MRSLFNTQVRQHMDYCSQLWMPSKYVDIDTLEAIPQAWTLDKANPYIAGDTPVGYDEVHADNINTEEVQAVYDYPNLENP